MVESTFTYSDCMSSQRNTSSIAVANQLSMGNVSGVLLSSFNELDVSKRIDVFYTMNEFDGNVTKWYQFFKVQRRKKWNNKNNTSTVQSRSDQCSEKRVNKIEANRMMVCLTLLLYFFLHSPPFSPLWTTCISFGAHRIQNVALRMAIKCEWMVASSWAI